MKIRFLQDRILVKGRRVAAGEVLDLPDGQAYINNGVAEAVAVQTKKIEEVTDNG